MGEAYFYHLTHSPLEETLPALLQKSREAGWRVLVRGGDAARLAWLDERLWLGEGFLPHGLAGGAHDAEQPVLLSAAPGTAGVAGAANGAEVLMAIDGAEVTAAEVAAFARVCLIFDGNDAAALEAARDQWRRLTAAGLPARYWSQDSGRWEQKAAKNLPA
jgi:DNA polymerase-3 subunit chi